MIVQCFEKQKSVYHNCFLKFFFYYKQVWHMLYWPLYLQCSAFIPPSTRC